MPVGEVTGHPQWTISCNFFCSEAFPDGPLFLSLLGELQRAPFDVCLSLSGGKVSRLMASSHLPNTICQV
jgi:hypothetical protein